MTAEFTGEVHPFADLFPLLPSDQLQELADDIAENGQLHPILLSPEGVLLDGRNRLEACHIAGIPPKFETVEGDPYALIISANAKRRQMSAGQRAMAVGLGMWERGDWDAEAGRWRYGTKNGANAPINDLKFAGTILAHSRDTALQVLAGLKPLRPTYDEVKKEHREAEERQRQYRELEQQAPDILAMITEEFSFDMAYAAYITRDKERIEREENDKETRKKWADDTADMIDVIASHICTQDRRDFFDTIDFTKSRRKITPQMIVDARTVLNHIERTVS